MLVQGIFLLITVQTANVQYPAQPPSAIFPNHSVIVDSPIADASILGKLLKQGDGCVVYLYNHKSWKSAQVAVTVAAVADDYRSVKRLKWFAINCAYSRCGEHFKQEHLPQIQYYVRVRTANTRAAPVVYRDDLWSKRDLAQFVHRNHFAPFDVFYAPGELDAIKTRELSVEALVVVSPPRQWSSRVDDRQNGLYAFTHDVRLLQNSIRARVVVLNYNQTSLTHPIGHVDLFSPFHRGLNLTKTELARLEIRARPRIQRIRHIANGDIAGAKNNYIWRQAKKAMTSGYVIVLLGLANDQLTEINGELSTLTHCHNAELCLANHGRCLIKDRPDQVDCYPHNNQWHRAYACCGADVVDSNPLCAFNQTVQTVSLPSAYSIIAERYGHVSTPKVGAPVKGSDSGVFIFDMRHDRVATFDYETPGHFRLQLEASLLRNQFDESLSFELIPCRANATRICLDRLVTRRAHGSSSGNKCRDYDAVVQSKTQTVLVALITQPCGTCDILSRLLIQLQLFFRQRLSPQNQDRLKIMALNVSRNKVPVIINFPTYPQLLAYPKMAEQRTSTSVAFDMTRPLTFNNLLLWVLSALDKESRMIIALELQTRKPVLTSEDAILSMYNNQQAQMANYEEQLDELKSNEQYLKRTIQEKSEKITKLEKVKNTHQAKLRSLNRLARDMLAASNDTVIT